MSKSYYCNNVIIFDKPGYGRHKDCTNCGCQVSAETYYQKTAVCQAIICRKCGKSRHPVNHCRCDK